MLNLTGQVSRRTCLWVGTWQPVLAIFNPVSAREYNVRWMGKSCAVSSDLLALSFASVPLCTVCLNVPVHLLLSLSLSPLLQCTLHVFLSLLDMRRGQKADWWIFSFTAPPNSCFVLLSFWVVVQPATTNAVIRPLISSSPHYYYYYSSRRALELICTSWHQMRRARPLYIYTHTQYVCTHTGEILNAPSHIK